MCKIITNKIENNSKVYGTGFFVELNDNKYGLLTNNHVINKIEIGNIVWAIYFLTLFDPNLNFFQKFHFNQKSRFRGN